MMLCTEFAEQCSFPRKATARLFSPLHRLRATSGLQLITTSRLLPRRPLCAVICVGRFVLIGDLSPEVFYSGRNEQTTSVCRRSIWCPRLDRGPQRAVFPGVQVRTLACRGGEGNESNDTRKLVDYRDN